MKKSILLFAAAAMAVSASAQTVTESKTFDNFYLGINGGVATRTTGHSTWMKDIQPNAGLRLGRWFTPVFGLAAESNVYFRSLGRNHLYGNGFNTTHTVANGINTSLLATVNLSNWFGGYLGEPRTFEVIPVFGFGWGHSFGHGEAAIKDVVTSKAGIDFTFNLGAKKAWQLYIEPSINWALNGNPSSNWANVGYEGTEFNINRSAVQLNVGVNYKFGNSNGTHNFTIAQLRDQAEIDGLNAQINGLRNDLNGKDATINGLRNDLSAKDRQIQDLQNALDECNKAPKKAATATNLAPTVLFRQGKSVVDNSQLPNCELIAQYMKNHPEAKVEIKGYASPEGSQELNQKLSEARAEAVKTVLVKRYKIAADRLTTQGMGATDKLFEQVEFNRVATFNDNSK